METFNGDRTMMKWILNAFSANMIKDFPVNVSFREVSVEEAASLVIDSFTTLNNTRSGVGHADTAAVFSSVLGKTVEMNRVNVSLSAGDSVLVGQYSGPRLPEGCKELPEGATIKWLVVDIG
jgi:hypothetical protein